MMKKIIELIGCIWIAGVLLVACETPRVQRIEVGETVDVSGGWNDSDSRMVSEEMIADVLSRPWLDTYKNSHQGKAPTVIVGTVRNRSDEHINTRTFVKDLERSLINSGQVEFVADQAERQEVREERKDQAAHSSEATAKEEGQELGADFMLQGSINTITDRLEDRQVRFYQVNLELIDIKSHKKVWIGEKKIKKLVERSSVGM